jgi:hypothetical protein
MAMRTLAIVILGLICTLGYSAEPTLKALIMDGQNNHDAWPKTTFMMKKYLEDTGRYQVDIVRTKTTWKGEALLKDFPLHDGVTREATRSHFKSMSPLVVAWSLSTRRITRGETGPSSIE